MNAARLIKTRGQPIFQEAEEGIDSGKPGVAPSKKPVPGSRPHSARAAEKKGRAGTMAHDCKRNGATTLPEDPMGKEIAPFRFASAIVRGDRSKGGSGPIPVDRHGSLTSDLEH